MNIVNVKISSWWNCDILFYNKDVKNILKISIGDYKWFIDSYYFYFELLTVGYWIYTNCPHPAASSLIVCHASGSIQSRLVHTIEWCLYVMTPQLKPDYPEASDITTTPPPPTPLHPLWLLVISDHLEVTTGHSLSWVQWSHWLLLHGQLWPAPSPCSCHLELIHHRESSVPTTEVCIFE